MASKYSSHDISRRGKDRVRLLINNSDNAIFRELSDNDYGVDGLIEIFNNGYPTGMICYVQLKTTAQKIEELKFPKGFVSCPGISAPCLCYLNQNRIPFIIIYNSLLDGNSFYYKMLNGEVIKSDSRIRIPISNYCYDDVDKVIKLIKDFYN